MRRYVFEEKKIRKMRHQSDYIFLPGSPVFHTKDCPCILHARKIEASVYYRTAAKSRRPCKICKPEPDVQAAIPSEPKPKAAKKVEEPAIDFKEIVRAKLLGGAVIEVRRGSIIGYCHNLKHPGKLTKSILDEHKRLEKQCPLLEKI